MTNLQNHTRIIKKYFITIFAALALSFSFCLVLELYSLFNCEKLITFEEKNIEQLEQIFTIEDLQKVIAKDKNNYFAIIKLANVYDNMSDFKTANKYYELALNVSGGSNYTLYNYALFLIKHKFYLMGINLAERLQGHSKKIYFYKTRIYESLADGLTEKKEMQGANKAYQVAYKYVNVIKDKDYAKIIKEKYAVSYINLADYYIEKGDVDYGIASLKNSVAIKQNPLALYKLALILRETDPEQAEMYFSKVSKINPYLINPYIYNTLLNDLIAKYKNQNVSRADFYITKKNNFDKNLVKNYVFRFDLDIQNSQIISEKKFLKKDKKNYLLFDIRNTSSNEISNLFLKAELFSNKEIFDIEKRIVSPNSKLGANQILENTSIKLPDEMELIKDTIANDIVIKYFARKNDKAPWTIIKIDSVSF